MRRFTLLSGCLWVGAAFLLGCGDQYAGRKAVSGRIMAEGKPLKEGLIKFLPVDQALGSSSGAPIKDGDYSIERKNGLKPGQYIVQITAGDGKTPPNMEEAGNPGGSTNIISFDLIPPDFGSRSTQKVDVKDSGDNVFNFDIPKLLTPPVQRKR